jgi:hypothetical protein
MEPGSGFLRDDTAEFAGWTVVDFKTDREFEETSDRYIVQEQAARAPPTHFADHEKIA